MQPDATALDLPSVIRSPELVEAFLRVQPHPQIDTATKGHLLVREDDFADHAILLLDGWVAFSKMLPDGETQIIDILLPGDFALIGATNAPVAACSVEALSDVRFIYIRSAHANGTDADMVGLRELMAGEIVRTQARTAELLLRLGKGNAASRLAYALLELYVRLESLGRAQAGRFTFPMTQHKIGELTGLSNVHVCRTLRRFEREGLIAHPTQTDIILSDMKALSEIAGVDIEMLQHEILVHHG
jgi:CRP/FNR family transcriptional regulator